MTTSKEATPFSQTGSVWDAGLYDSRHAFVWKHGAALLDLLAPQAGERILDLGCGTGHLTAGIRERGAQVVGLDSSREMLDQARSAYPDLEFVEGDARSFNFSEPFDAIFSNAVLHWVQPPEAVAHCVYRALKPRGRFVAELGGRGNIQIIHSALRQAGERLGLSLPVTPWYFPSVAEYATVLEKAGLEVHLATLFARPTPLEGKSGLRDWVRMFARSLLETVPPGRQEEFLELVEESARPALFQQGTWIADYRRLRIVALRNG